MLQTIFYRRDFWNLVYPNVEPSTVFFIDTDKEIFQGKFYQP